MASHSKFRRPEDIEKSEPREPVSARIKQSTKRALEKASKANALSLGELIEAALEDYVAFLGEKDRKKRD